jgi:hypothetical protein
MLLLLQENQINSTASKQDRFPMATAREIAREQTGIGALARHEEKKIRTDGNCGPNMSGTRNLKTQRTAIGIVRRGSTRKRNHERKTAKKIQRGQKSRRQAGDRTNPGRQQPNRVLARAPREQNPTRGQHTAQKNTSDRSWRRGWKIVKTETPTVAGWHGAGKIFSKTEIHGRWKRRLKTSLRPERWENKRGHLGGIQRTKEKSSCARPSLKTGE